MTPPDLWSICVWSGLSCAAYALLGTRRDLAAAAQRLSSKYDRSRRGRRLSVRLDSARIDLAPSQWRTAQALIAVPVVVAAAGLVASPWLALSGGLGVIRVGGRLILRVRRPRRDRAILEAAPQLARSLAAELSASTTPASALAAVARPCDGLRINRELAEAAVQRIGLGESPATALDCAVRGLVGTTKSPGADAVRLVARHFVLHTQSGGDVGALRRLADALDAERRVHDSARASTTELRVAAMAVPVLTALVTTVLAVGDPGVAMALMSVPELFILTVCVTVAVAGVVGVRRLTAW